MGELADQLLAGEHAGLEDRPDGAASAKHVYTNGEGYYVAASAEGAERCFREHLEEMGENPDDYDACDWDEIPDGKVLRVWFEEVKDAPQGTLDADAFPHDHAKWPVIMTCREWAEITEGFLGESGTTR